MKRLLFIWAFVCTSICSMAQLSQNEQMKLADAVKRNYENYQIEGASLYKTSSGYQVLVTVTSVSSDKSVGAQNEEAQMKSTRLASEFLIGAVNSSVSILDTQSSDNRSKEELSEKIVQSSLAQVQAMQPLFKTQGNDGQSVFAYFLVISQTAAKNGVAGALSIIPGVGQFYKGNAGKGIMFLSLAAASAAGIIVCESTRASYANKAVEQPKYKKDYTTKADNWATSRNVCIGVGCAVWAWNIIDAFTTKSAKRKVVTNPAKGLSVKPYASPDLSFNSVNVGFGLSYHF